LVFFIVTQWVVSVQWNYFYKLEYLSLMVVQLATPSAAHLLLYSYVQRKFDYCSVHVSTVISHVSQQFRFLVFFIVTQWVVSVQWNYFYKLEYLSLMVVQVSLNGLKRCTKI
ncbi:hypothetical protein T01_7673, partial [Trichinella spiralis]